MRHRSDGIVCVSVGIGDARSAVLLAIAAALGVLVAVVRSWRSIMWVTLSLLVVYAWAYPGSTDYVWIFGVQSFMAGLHIALRLVGFVTVLNLLLATTGPLAIVGWAGDVNEDLGVMVSLTLSILPVMKREMDVTLEAQQARGFGRRRELVRRGFAHTSLCSSRSS